MVQGWLRRFDGEALTLSFPMGLGFFKELAEFFCLRRLGPGRSGTNAQFPGESEQGLSVSLFDMAKLSLAAGKLN